MKKIIIYGILLGLLHVGSLFSQQTYEANWASIDSRPVPQWFSDAKFGIFIHWGLYSVPAWGPLPSDGAGIYDCYAEWYWWKLSDKQNKVNPLFTAFHNKTYGEDFKYQDFVQDFRCGMFNPGEWAKLFREAGARYVVLTSKHHEGFALWPSAQSWNWNSVDVGPHRDLCGDLTEAVKKEGLHMGFYYSLYEWFNPLYKNNVEKYVDEHMIPQMKDLVTRYSPEVIFADGEWDHPSETWKSVEFLAWLYNESPVKETVVANDRWGKETRSKHGGYYTTEYDLVHDGNVKDTKIAHPWEECRGIGHSFGYNRNENLADYSTSEQLVHLLVEKVAMGGNLLLNIGPTADGRIPVIMQQRLTDMGGWLKVNGEAIYDTSPWVMNKQPEAGIYFTAKGKDLYVICTQFPGKTITIPSVGKRPASVTLLGSKAPVRYSYAGKSIGITPPSISPADNPYDYAWVFKLSGCL
ncbi:MAG: alpha-L-fucosidase [Tannerella sp.]|jgi:alpha-L-fucosidase|nr:alpha-L-fucosidase [Tannerella sp.]